MVRTGDMAADRCWYEKDWVVGSGAALGAGSAAGGDVRPAAGAPWGARAGVLRAAPEARPRVGAGPAVAADDPRVLAVTPGISAQA